MTSADYDLIALKGHVMDDRGQYYVINSRQRKRDGRKLTAEITCSHVMFKLADVKVPYASYIKELYGAHISQLTDKITAATGGRFSFVIHDTFPLYDVKDWGRTNCLAALNDVIKMYGAEIEADNFVIHVRKRIGTDSGHQYRIGKNVISSAFKDDGSALTTRLYARMKDDRTWIGQPATILTADERSRLAAIPGAIVSGVLQVNYLVSQYAAAWSTPDTPYYDAEIIEQSVTDVNELLRQARKALAENEIPALEIDVDAADIFKLDATETKPDLGDTVYCVDPDMELPNITARITEITEYPFDRDKHTQVTVANVMGRDMEDILADLDRAKRIVHDIMSGGTIRTEVFEAFAKQAITDITNSKTELVYPEEGGILARDKANPLRQVRLTAAGLGVSTDGWNTVRAAITADGIIGERIIGQIGNFESLSVGSGNNIILLNRTAGLSAGNAVFSNAPFRVDFQGNVTARSITLTGKIEQSTMESSTLTGNLIRTAASGQRIEIDVSGLRAIGPTGLKRISIEQSGTYGVAGIEFRDQYGVFRGILAALDDGFYVQSSSRVNIAANIVHVNGVMTDFFNSVDFSSASVSGLRQSSIVGLQSDLSSINSQLANVPSRSQTATNMSFDTTTRNLKLYSVTGATLATVNIP